EDVRVSEGRRTVVVRRRSRRVGGRPGRGAVGDVLPVGVDRGTVRGVARVVPDGDDEVVRRERIVVVAEELVDERVRARASGVAGRPAVDIGPGADRTRRAIDVGVADDALEQTWVR